MSHRIQYFDALRGIAIMMVVGIHTFQYPLAGDGYGMALLIRQIFNCAVPLFLAISGYFLASKDLTTKDNYVSFIGKQIPKVYIPCLIWAIPMFVKDIYTDGISFKAIILFLLCGYSIYYFVALIIQYYLLLPVLQKVKGLKWGGQKSVFQWLV